MAAGNDYYDTLGISRTATDDEIRTAFRSLARKYHPDVSKEPDSEKRFAEVQEAYEVLSDTEKRQAYDRFGHAGAAAAGGAPGGGGWDYRGSGGQQVDPGAFQEIFEEMFRGQSGRSDPFSSGARRPRRGADVSQSLTITFLTAALGGEETVTLADGTSVTLRIPPGIEDGGRLRIRDKGSPGPDGGPPGDVIVTVRVGGHPVFRRSGLDLLIDVPVSIVEAVRGTAVTIPLLQGEIELRIPPGSSSGRKLRIGGRGIANSEGRQGDFYAIIQIRAPSSERLSEAGQSALDTLSAELPDPREGLF